MAVFVGGAAGTSIRMGVAQLWFDPSFPWPTFAVNLVGALGLGYLAGSLTRRPDVFLRFGVGAGVFGGLTTFSTFVVEVVELGEAASPAAGLAYAGTSVVFGAMLSVAGVTLGRR